MIPCPFEEFIPTDPFERHEWHATVLMSLRYPPMMEAFRDDTGSAWHPASTAIEKMLDEAAGEDIAFLVQYLKWFRDSVWRVYR